MRLGYGAPHALADGFVSGTTATIGRSVDRLEQNVNRVWLFATMRAELPTQLIEHVGPPEERIEIAAVLEADAHWQVVDEDSPDAPLDHEARPERSSARAP